MTALGDLAEVFRSKNAGPFEITIDLMFPNAGVYEHVLHSGALTATVVAARYGVAATDVRIIPFASIYTIKVTFPRSGPSSGAPGDRDVYGAQQHGPLLSLEIPAP